MIHYASPLVFDRKTISLTITEPDGYKTTLIVPQGSRIEMEECESWGTEAGIKYRKKCDAKRRMTL